MDKEEFLHKWRVQYWVKSSIYDNALKHDEEQRKHLFNNFTRIFVTDKL